MMKQIANKSYRQLILFTGIGILNTTIDVVIYLILRNAKIPVLIANIISTSVALVVSYSLNKRYTFQVTSSDFKTIVLFLVVTLSGLWILQPVIIKLALYVFHSSYALQLIKRVILHPDKFIELIAKLSATPATLLWNFFLYRKYVFPKKNTDITR
ncbi:MAG: hypothetical protein NVSMB46_06290 [Candidatus Saccharimonadales bacterium]